MSVEHMTAAENQSNAKRAPSVMSLREMGYKVVT